ncbi:hypothetical protein O6H91_Y521800 [Diphasiastrum complanatum]|nr:hypothetical protein O6H91_Y521800 [Diphasiastrum complanatum]
MAPTFVIPSSLRDLETPPEDVEDGLYAQEIVSVEAMSPAEADELVKKVAFELADGEVICVEEQSVFDQVYSLVKYVLFIQLHAQTSLRVVESVRAFENMMVCSKEQGGFMYTARLL